MQLSGKVALVTGSSTGIGNSIALRFAKEGALVTIDYLHHEETAQQLKGEIEKLGGKALVIQADVSKVADCQNLVAQTVSAYGHIDVLVNNAGVESRTSLVDSSEEHYDRVMNTNLKGAFFCAQAAAKEMIKNKRGVIINISSVHEDLPMPGNTPYCLSKGGMRMLTRNAAMELAEHNINVVGIGPGAIDTPINKETMEDPEKKKALLAEIPLKRVGTTEEIAGLATYLASSEGSYVTGTTFFIDGGLMHNTAGL